MIKRPTIVDVARVAGVSKSTVSLVLQNSALVKDETASLIRKTMADIGYVYNRSAANLRSSNAGLIGLVINDLRNPFFTEFATSAQMAFSARGYTTVIANTDEDPALQAQTIGSMIEHGVSALVISPTYGNEAATFDPIARAGIPTMQVLRRVDPRTHLFPFASLDYAHGGRLATQHLVDTGAKNIAFIGGFEGRPITQERMSGYLEI
ncbi:MAG: LacI family DNA-binding transcriptional regulator, partial [Paracoccaceae bacterium]